MINILIVGCGNMGSAILGSWYKRTSYKFSVIDPKKYNFLKKKYGKKILVFKNLEEIKNLHKFQIILFAVKPQISQGIINQFKYRVNNKVLFVSIIAGKKIKFIQNILGSNSQIIRVMPNMPAIVEKGMTCLISNKNVSKKNKLLITKLFKLVGSVVWLKKELDVDKITAISGSGPAYFFIFVEYLEAIAQEFGFSKTISKQLVYQTAFGSIDLLLNDKRTAKELKNNIAIKGGTTEAAINILQNKSHFKKIIRNALKAAYKRSIQLGR